MNDLCSTNYQDVDANLRLITARLEEGYTVQLLKQVVSLKQAEWGDDPEMRQYLRPATLFGKEKCAQYAGQCNTRGQRPEQATLEETGEEVGWEVGGSRR